MEINNFNDIMKNCFTSNRINEKQIKSIARSFSLSEETKTDMIMKSGIKRAGELFRITEPYKADYSRICNNSQDFEAEGFELAKIAYEEGAVLDFYVSEDSILNLSAVRNLDGDL